jgi:hypothetical protein
VESADAASPSSNDEPVAEDRADGAADSAPADATTATRSDNADDPLAANDQEAAESGDVRAATPDPEEMAVPVSNTLDSTVVDPQS